MFGHNALGVVINQDTVLGNNVFFQHHSSTGVRWQGGSAPTICDNVRIGAYTILLGPITIGQNCKIGAGSIITHDIPSNSVVYNKKEVIAPRTNRYDN